MDFVIFAALRSATLSPLAASQGLLRMLTHVETDDEFSMTFVASHILLKGIIDFNGQLSFNLIFVAAIRALSTALPSVFDTSACMLSICSSGPPHVKIPRHNHDPIHMEPNRIEINPYKQKQSHHIATIAICSYHWLMIRLPLGHRNPIPRLNVYFIACPNVIMHA